MATENTNSQDLRIAGLPDACPRLATRSAVAAATTAMPGEAAMLTEPPMPIRKAVDPSGYDPRESAARPCHRAALAGDECEPAPLGDRCQDEHGFHHS